MLSMDRYVAANRDDPIRFYDLPIIGRLYRRRIELCLGELSGGKRILEVGFGSGVAFPNLHETYEEIHGVDVAVPVQQVMEVFRAEGIETDLRNASVLGLPYQSGYFDSVLLISILEHLRPNQLFSAFQEIGRVLKPGGQAVYGTPIDRALMRIMFRLLGYDIRQFHYSTEREIARAAGQFLKQIRAIQMHTLIGPVYEVLHFVKPERAV